jgi:hypothetical protein
MELENIAFMQVVMFKLKMRGLLLEEMITDIRVSLHVPCSGP